MRAVNRRAEFELTTALACDADTAWARMTTMAGINDEFKPLLQMTAPADVREAGLAGVTPGERICRSWLLLFGLIPIDYDDLVLESIGPGTEFHERSTMLTQRLWHHDRVVVDTADGCTVTDRVAWESRLPIPGAIQRPIFKTVFRYRHHRLKRYFGAAG